jgi:hypothetical protein
VNLEVEASDLRVGDVFYVKGDPRLVYEYREGLIDVMGWDIRCHKGDFVGAVAVVIHNTRGNR